MSIFCSLLLATLLHKFFTKLVLSVQVLPSSLLSSISNIYPDGLWLVLFWLFFCLFEFFFVFCCYVISRGRIVQNC